MPREWDVLRDIGIAQSLEDGRYPEDPVLAGEISWYNPLTALLLTVTRFVSGISLMRIAVLSGPIINLLAPVAFYVLVFVLFGHGAALAALFLFLFGKDGTTPSYWTCAYSPWLLAPLYSSGLLFFTLALFKNAIEKKSNAYFIATGLMLGLTFLGHTAPAVIAGATMALLTAVEAWRQKGTKGQRNEACFLISRFLILVLVAFFVSLPYTGPLLWRYQFHIQNPWPSLYASQNVELQNFPEQFYNAFMLRNGIALLGAIVVFYRYRGKAARLMVCWAIVVCAFLIQQYVWQLLRLKDIIIPSVVPGHHAAIHLSALRTIFFGIGIVTLGKITSRLLIYSTSSLSFIGKQTLLLRQGCICLFVIVTGVCLYLKNPYSRRIDFQPPAGTAHENLYERHVPMYEWIRDNTSPDAVFLCPDENLGIKVVMPAGRKLVNPMLLYFNPYVNRGPLTLRKEKILKALEKHDSESLCQASRDFPSLYLLLDEPVAEIPPSSIEVHQTGGSRLFELHPCPRKIE